MFFVILVTFCSEANWIQFFAVFWFNGTFDCYVYENVQTVKCLLQYHF